MMKYYEEGEIPSDYLSLTHGKDKPIQFEFLARLGEGSYGEVILVRTLDTKEIFAIKRIRVRDLGTGCKYTVISTVCRNVMTLYCRKCGFTLQISPFRLIVSSIVI